MPPMREQPRPSIAADAVQRDLELLDSGARNDMARALNDNSAFSARLPIVVGGERRFYDVHALKVTGGSAGIAIDASEATALRDALVRMAEAHRRTLDQLSSGVAVFDGQRRLAFYNDSYRRLWDLDRAFLDGNPDDSSVLDRLRAARKLQEQPDFRAWKAKLHEAYRAIEPAKDRWYLPDGRAISVVTTPNPEGGVTYLFDDVTESLELARQYRRPDQCPARDAGQSRRSRRGVRQQWPRAIVQPGLCEDVEAVARRTARAAPYRDRGSLVQAAIR